MGSGVRDVTLADPLSRLIYCRIYSLECAYFVRSNWFFHTNSNYSYVFIALFSFCSE